MRILHVLAGAEHGGAEMAFVDMCIAMKERGEDVFVACRDNPTRTPLLKTAGLQPRFFPFGGKLDLYTPWMLRRYIMEIKPDIVHCWMSRAADKTPAWTQSMGIPRYLKLGRLGGYYKAKYFRTCDYFTTITPDIKRHLVDEGFKADTIAHINNFAETEDDFTPVNRADLNTPDDAPLFLALGRLHRAKAIDTLLRAMTKVDGAFLWIAGDGPDRADLETLCGELGLGDRVRFLGWRTDRAALFAASDICVFPSRYEPFGTVFVQAWANKTPLITTDADGPKQYVRDGEDGLMVPADDVDALANAMKKLIKDKALCEKLVKNGYARYQGEFAKDIVVGQYLDWYRTIRQKQA